MAKKVIVDIELNQAQSTKRAAELRGELEKLSTQRNALRKQLKALQSDEKANADELKAVASQLNAVENNTKTTRKELNVLNTSLNAAANSLNAKRARLKALNFEYDNFRVGIDGTGDDLQELGKKVRNLSDDIKAQEESTGRAQRSVGDYGKAIRDTFNGDFAGIKDLRSNIQGLGKSLLSPQGAVLALGTAAIATGVKLVGMRDSLEEARRETILLTGATGELANAATANGSAVAEVFDQDFNEILRAANTGTKALGGSIAENITAIGEGFASVGKGSAGELLDILKEYPDRIDSSTFSYREFVAVASQQIRDGVFSDKGIDAIAEAQVRIREMPQATRDALAGIGISGEGIQKRLTDGTSTFFEEIQKVSSRLNELPAESTEVGTVLADVFGSGGEEALRYVLSLENVETSLTNLVESGSEANDIYLQQTQATAELNNELLNTIGSTEGFRARLQVLGTKALTFVVRIIGELIEATDFLRAGFTGVIAVGGELGERLTDSFTKAKNSIQIAGLEIQKAVTFDDSKIEELNDRIELLKNSNRELSEGREALGDVFINSSRDALKAIRDQREAERQATIAFEEEQTKRAAAIEKLNQIRGGGPVSNKEKEAARKKEEAARKKEAKELEKQQRELLKKQKELAELEKKQALDKLKAQQANLKVELIQIENNSFERTKILIKIAENERDIKLQNDKLLAEERLLIEAETQEKINAISEKALEDDRKRTEEQIQQRKEAAEKELEERKQREEIVIDGINRTIASSQQLGELLTAQADERAEQRIAAIEGNSQLSESEKERAIATVEAEKERSGAYKAGKAIQKAAAIAELGINLGRQLSEIATTSAKISGAFPPISVPIGIAYGVTQGALALAQSGRRISEIRALEEGGFTSDPGLMTRGGFVDRPTISTMSSGSPVLTGEAGTEYVISAPMLANPGIRKAVSSFEDYRVRGLGHSGRYQYKGIPAFQDGGFTQAASNSQNEIRDAIASALQLMPSPIVTVEDINRGQANRANVESSGNIQ